jgi:hypothetical protein
MMIDLLTISASSDGPLDWFCQHQLAAPAFATPRAKKFVK